MSPSHTPSYHEGRSCALTDDMFGALANPVRRAREYLPRGRKCHQRRGIESPLLQK